MVKIKQTYFYIHLGYQNLHLIKKYKMNLKSVFLKSRQEVDGYYFFINKNRKKRVDIVDAEMAACWPYKIAHK